MEKNSKKIIDTNGKEHISVAKCELNNRFFVITVDKKIFEKDNEGNFKECLENDDTIILLKEYIKSPKSLDINRGQ